MTEDNARNAVDSTKFYTLTIEETCADLSDAIKTLEMEVEALCEELEEERGKNEELRDANAQLEMELAESEAKIVNAG